MSVIFIDGFDHYIDYDDVQNKWTFFYYAGFSVTYRRFDTGEGLCFQNDNYYLRKIFDNNYSTIVIGVGIKLAESIMPTYNSSYPFLTLYDADDSDYQLSFYFVDYTIRVYRGLGGTLLGTSTDVFSTWNEWKFLEIKSVINNSSGSVEIRSDESTVLNLTSIDTQNTTNAYVNRFSIMGVYNNVMVYYDDLYIDDSDFLGDVRVYNFNPDGDGTYSQFTPSTGSNYQCVDEGQPNNDTDYVSSAVSGNKDTYTFTTGPLKTVMGLQLTNYVKKADVGQRKIRNLCRSNGSDYRSDKRDLNSGDYRAESYLWETDPDDSNTWTQTKIEAAEFGLEIATTTTTSSTTTTTTTTP